MPKDPASRIERIRTGLLRLDDEDLRDMIDFATDALNKRTGQQLLFVPQVPDGEEGPIPSPHRKKGLGPAGPAFERWWVKLPGPMKKQKGRAERYWKRIWLQWRGPGTMEGTLTKAIATQARHEHFRGRDGNCYWPNGSTWLNDSRWADDVQRTDFSERVEPAKQAEVPQYVKDRWSEQKKNGELIRDRAQKLQIEHPNWTYMDCHKYAEREHDKA